jgi:ClpP class serine protease
VKLYTIKSTDPIDYAKIKEELKKALKDRTIDIIDISINAPGGEISCWWEPGFIKKK